MYVQLFLDAVPPAGGLAPVSRCLRLSRHRIGTQEIRGEKKIINRNKMKLRSRNASHDTKEWQDAGACGELQWGDAAEEKKKITRRRWEEFRETRTTYPFSHYVGIVEDRSLLSTAIGAPDFSDNSRRCRTTCAAAAGRPAGRRGAGCHAQWGNFYAARKVPFIFFSSGFGGTGEWVFCFFGRRPAATPPIHKQMTPNTVLFRWRIWMRGGKGNGMIGFQFV